MIMLTGDTHGYKGIVERIQNFDMDGDGENFLIVLGDFSLLWNKKNYEFQVEHVTEILEGKNFKLLFLDGNHENFNLLEEMPTVNWKGGEISIISENIYRLKTGHVFEIEGKKLAVFGGATSIDRHLRTFAVSWWIEEIPCPTYMRLFIGNLAKNDYKVDYLLTHTTKKSTIEEIFGSYRFCPVSEYLEYLHSIYNIDYKMNYFGHFHGNTELAPQKSLCLYEDIIELGESYE